MGRRPRVLVTGLRHSGTTYTARLLEGAGLDAGPEDELLQVSERQGMEWIPLWRLAGKVADDAGRSVAQAALWTDPTLRKAAMDANAEEIRSLVCPELVKVPDYGHLVVRDLKPDTVVVVTRPWPDWLGSMQANGPARALGRPRLRSVGMQALEDLYAGVRRHCTDVVKVSYPALVSGGNPVLRLAVDLGLDPGCTMQTWQEITRPAWDGENARRYA